MLVGYARVSTDDQDTRMQMDALRKAGVDRLFQEKGSGVGPRPVLHQALASIREGDVLVVWKLDRFARSVRHIWTVLDELKAKGAGFRSLTEPVDTSTPLGEFMLNMLASLAQFERALIRERSMAGQVAAMRRGVKFGRDPVMTFEDRQLAALMVWSGCTYASVGRFFGVSRATIWRAEREMRGVPDSRPRPIFHAATVALR